MLKVLHYSFFDLVRSRWVLFYALFYFITGSVFLLVTGDASRAAAGLMQIVLLFLPLISCVLASIHFYNTRDFIELLLTQPIKRRLVFLGNYAGIALSLSLAYAAGLCIPIAISIFRADQASALLLLLIIGVLLTFIFTALGYWISLLITDRTKGIGAVLALWLCMAVLYDGVFLLLLHIFKEYPLEKLSLALVALNPIDLSRILFILQLDEAALMGFTGAVFQQFFGTVQGIVIAGAILLLWVALPVVAILRTCLKKDF